MRIAFIVQRYGAEILGGSEYHCRLIAERLAPRHQVEVLTTCAADYISWKNEYAEGADRVRGVTVRRFANARTRDIQAFNRYSEWIFNNPHTRDDEIEWLRQQGPWCPALLDYVERNQHQYDVLIFFTYLYAPTVLGVRIAPHKTILVPTAHDEPAIHLSLYKDVFRLPAGVAFNTDVERRFLESVFTFNAIVDDTIGCGVDLPQSRTYLPEPSYARPEASSFQASPQPDVSTDPSRGGSPDAASDVNGGVNGGEEAGDGGQRFPSHLTSRGATFRRRHRLHGRFALYGGRIDPGKGCEELLQYFHAYASAGGDASLVLMGAKLMPLPEDPSVIFAGRLSEMERFDALEAATVVTVPSPYESLSLLALESFAVGTPILANARSDVLVDHCLKSNAGLFYADQDEFVECLKLLTVDERLRRAMGQNGRDYVRRTYRWDVILGKYDRMLSAIRSTR
jgi:glycosyltransferase involved in cell wall biosynthesis